MPPRLPTPRSSSPLPRHAAALLTGLCLLLTAHAAHAARLALVVGNDSYRHVDPLKNAVRDAELMQKTLADAGFQVTLQRNLGRQALYDAVDQFQRRVNNGDEVVFFFAGHGVQVASDQVLLPVDIQADDEKKVLREGVPLLYVQEALKGARLALVVVDACRDNPFPKTGGTRSIGDSRGLKPPEAAKGQAVILSAGRGEKALDTVPGQPTARNGLFTWEFAQVLRTPGLDVLTALRRVRDRVEDRAATVGHQQRPSLVDDLRGDFYLTVERKDTGRTSISEGSDLSASLRRDRARPGEVVSIDEKYILFTPDMGVNNWEIDLYNILDSMRNIDFSKMQGLILDLRGVGSASIEAAESLVRPLLPWYSLVAVGESSMGKRRIEVPQLVRVTGGRDIAKSAQSSPYEFLAKTPIVVLTDESLGLAAQIVAAALQDNKRAIVMGRGTLGVSSKISEPDEVWYRPNGISLSKIGVSPDIWVDAGVTFGGPVSGFFDNYIVQALNRLEGRPVVVARTVK